MNCRKGITCWVSSWVCGSRIFVCNGSSNVSLNDWHVVPTKQQFLTCPSVQPLAITILLSPFFLTTLDASSKGNYAVFVPQWLACSPQHGTLWGHTFCQIWQDFLLFKGWVVFHLYYAHTGFSLSSIYGHQNGSTPWLTICISSFLSLIGKHSTKTQTIMVRVGALTFS